MRQPETRDYDAIVIGSGISGGWAAKELTERGLRTLVLEAGRSSVPCRDYAEHKPVGDAVPRARRSSHVESRQAMQRRSVSCDEWSHRFVG